MQVLPIQIVPKSINYKFYIALSKLSYKGIAQITFAIPEVDFSNILLNFKGHKIKSLYINEREVQEVNYNGTHIVLVKAQLAFGTNLVIVEYQNEYNVQGYGLTYLTDVDQREYVYTHFEPQGCRNVFPCFDHPNLKSRMELVIFTPKHWIANSNQKIQYCGSINLNTLETQKHISKNTVLKLAQITKDYLGTMWVFAKTQILPTYCFSFIAGQYIQLKCPNPHKQIPISLFGIKSFFHHISQYQKLIWKVINQTLNFYEQLFKVPYSFSKCDHVFVFELQTGAMQNAGLIIYNYNYVNSSQLTPNQLMCLCTVIAHELAHQWFGNLVTLKQWGEIWLNEGFAQFLAYFCLNSIKSKLDLDFQADFMHILQEKKSLGCRHDKSCYSHPIRVKQIQNPLDVFDKIAYVKGAYVVKQLIQLLGNQFWQSIHQYFITYNWQNSTIDQLFFILEKHSHLKKINFQLWIEQWIDTKNYNILQVKWQGSQLKIIQSPASGDTKFYKSAKIKIALFKQDFSHDTIELILPHSECYRFDLACNYKGILLDFEDSAFFQQKFDPISSQFFKKNLKNIASSLMRGVIWRSFYEQVIRGNLLSSDFLGIVIDNFCTQDQSLAEYVLNNLANAINIYTPYKFRWSLKKIAFMILQELLKTQENVYGKRVLAKYLITFGNTTQGREVLKNWYYQNQNNTIAYKLNVSEKWTILKILAFNKQLDRQQTHNQIRILSDCEPNYSNLINKKMIDGIFMNEQQASVILQQILGPKRINSDLKEAIVCSYSLSSYSQSINWFRLLLQNLNTLSQAAWIQLFENILPKTDNIYKNIFDCEEMLKCVKDKQHLYIAVCKEIVQFKDRLQSYSQYNKSFQNSHTQ